jgi:Phosphomannomutase
VVTVIDFHEATLPDACLLREEVWSQGWSSLLSSALQREQYTAGFLDSTGAEISEDRLSDLLSMYESHRAVRSVPSRVGWVSYAEYIHDIYTASAVGFVDSVPISAKEPMVVVDMNNGPAYLVLPSLLSSLGARLIAVNSGKPAPRTSARLLPHPRTLMTLADMTRASGATFAAALSVDASQVFLIDDKGRFVDPDAAVAAVASLLPQGSRLAVLDSASRLVDMVAEKNKLTLIRVRGLASDVTRGMRRIRAMLGASDSGEFIYPQFTPAPDGMVFIAKLLEMLCTSEIRLSTLIESLPEVQRFTLEHEIEAGKMFSLLEYVLSLSTEVSVTPTSVKYKADDVWVKVEVDLLRSKMYVSAEAATRSAVEVVKREYERLVEFLESFA